jgi:hypothetical protein
MRKTSILTIHFEDYAQEVISRLEKAKPSEAPIPRGVEHAVEGTLVRIDQNGGLGSGYEAPPSDRDNLNEQERGILDSVLVEKGTDALAFYKSIRFRNEGPHPGMWGTYSYSDLGSSI